MQDTITISRAEYTRLIEAADRLSDLLAFDRIQAKLAAGEEEHIPAKRARRLIEGEIPLRFYRKFRGLTQVKLSALSGVCRVQITEIEAGRNNGSVETVRKLANALDVTIEDLI